MGRLGQRRPVCRDFGGTVAIALSATLFEALFGPLMGMPGDGFLNGLGRQSRILGKALNVSRLEQGITNTGNAGGDHLQSLAP